MRRFIHSTSAAIVRSSKFLSAFILGMVVTSVALLTLAFTAQGTPERHVAWNGFGGAQTAYGVLESTVPASGVPQIGVGLLNHNYTIVAETITGAASAENTAYRPRFSIVPGLHLDGTTISATAFQFDCDWETAGTGGTTGVVMKLTNVTDSSDLCTCVVGACTNAATVNNTCACGGASGTRFLVSGVKHYAIEMDSTTDCSANPQNVRCSLRINSDL